MPSKGYERIGGCLVYSLYAVASLYNNRLITFEEARTEMSNFTDIDPDNPKGEFKSEINNDGDKQIQEQVGEAV